MDFGPTGRYQVFGLAARGEESFGRMQEQSMKEAAIPEAIKSGSVAVATRGS